MGKKVINVLKIVGGIWLWGNFLLFLISGIGVFLESGFLEVLWFFSPLNWVNYLALAIGAAPGLILYNIACYFEGRAHES